MSLRASSGLPRICSGLMNSGVPRMIPVAVSLALAGALIRCEARRQDFDGDGLVGRDFLGEIDVRHPAFAQLFHDLIAGIQDLIGETGGAVQAGLPGWERRADAGAAG